MTPEAQFPIHPEDRRTLRSVPWALVAPYEQRAKSNHSQSLRTLAMRGGLGIQELYALLRDEDLGVVRIVSLGDALSYVKQRISELEGA